MIVWDLDTQELGGEGAFFFGCGAALGVFARQVILAFAPPGNPRRKGEGLSSPDSDKQRLSPESEISMEKQ